MSDIEHLKAVAKREVPEGAVNPVDGIAAYASSRKSGRVTTRPDAQPGVVSASSLSELMKRVNRTNEKGAS